MLVIKSEPKNKLAIGPEITINIREKILAFRNVS
jgi:hypothetical protein